MNTFLLSCNRLWVLGFSLLVSCSAASAANWPTAGGDLQNSRNAKTESKINKDNVDKLKVKWVFDNLPADVSLCSDNTPLQGNVGVASVSNSPAVDGSSVYFSDWCGFVTALDKDSGTVKWRRNMLSDISAEISEKFGVDIKLQMSRNTPAVSGDLILLGNEFFIMSPLCLTNKALNLASGGAPHYPLAAEPLAEFPTGAVYDALRKGPDNLPGFLWSCHEGNGAVVVALNKHTGAVEWYNVVSSHPAAKVTGSISVHGDTAFVPVGGWEEEWTRLTPNVWDLDAVDSTPGSPTFGMKYPAYLKLKAPENIDADEPYPCCSSTGMVVALKVTDGSKKWEKRLAIGVDLDNELDPKIKPLLGTKGFWGVSTYGNSMPIDTKRKQVYIATAETYNAPEIMQQCEIARRTTGNPDPVVPGLPDASCAPGQLNCYDTCNDLTAAFKTYGNAIVALDSENGKVKWSFFSRQYDAWVHACAAPDFNISEVVPVIFSDPISNAANCPSLVGPDYGFGHQPILVNGVKIGNKNYDLVIAGQKDGRLFALDADTGREIQPWADLESAFSGIQVGPGAIYGGMQFGISSDGKNVYVGIANAENSRRDIGAPFVSADDFLDINFNSRPPSEYSGPILRTAPHVGYDGAPAEERAGPGDMVPFLAAGPEGSTSSSLALFGSPTNGRGYPSDYPTFDDSNLIVGPNGPFFTGPRSGPRTLWALINPALDTKVDCVNTFVSDVAWNSLAPDPFVASCRSNYLGWTGQQVRTACKTMYTLAGFSAAIRISDGAILWQRPAIDSIEGEIGGSWVHGSTTVANGVVFVGYGDARGTMVALDAQTGKRLWKFNAIDAISGVPSGRLESSPSVVNGVVYWGVGAGSLSPFFTSNPFRTGTSLDANTKAAGNRVYSFDLPKKRDKKK